MKFLLDVDGNAVNLAFIEQIYSVGFGVRAKLRNDVISLCVFKGGDQSENRKAAKDFIAELVDQINSGGNLTWSYPKSSAS